jgi:hypothetical protein
MWIIILIPTCVTFQNSAPRVQIPVGIFTDDIVVEISKHMWEHLRWMFDLPLWHKATVNMPLERRIED